VGQGWAWLGKRRPGQSGSGATEAVRGESGVRRGQGGIGQGGWGRASSARGRVQRQREEQLVAVVTHVAIQRVEEMREREKREKERVEPQSRKRWVGGGEERTSELKTMEPDRSVLNKGVKKDGLETKHTMSMEE
jgi:hypothetical protein